MSETDTLMRFIALIVATASVTWLAVAIPLKISPKASLRFGLANILLLLSIVLALKRNEQPSYLYWSIADSCGIAAYLLVHSGLRELFKLPARKHLHWLLWIVSTALLFSFVPSPQAMKAFGVTYSSAAAIIFALTFYDAALAAKREFSWTAGMVIAWPFGVAALTMTWRTLLFAITPIEITQNIVEGKTLWPFVALALLLNISLISCVLARLVAKIRNYSEHDHLTGLLNRRAFELRLKHEHERCLRNENQYGLLLFDLDHFKKINDHFGHAGGDAALKHTAELLQRSLRSIDIAARYGGEEFIVLLPDTGNEQLVLVAERLRQTLASQALSWQTHKMTITASFGGVIGAQKPTETLLKLADKALYHAKHQGRNCVVMSN